MASISQFMKARSSVFSAITAWANRLLLKTVMGLVPTTGGSITFDGVDVTHEPSHGRSRLGIGYVPQGRGIFPTLSVRDNLRMGIASHGVQDEDDAIAAILHEFSQLERLLDRQGGALSGGEQQLLALARCLISDPQIVLLDEPTEGIQPSIVDTIEDKLRELSSRARVVHPFDRAEPRIHQRFVGSRAGAEEGPDRGRDR